MKSEHGKMETPEFISPELIVPIACHPCLIFICKVQSVYSYDWLKLVSTAFLYSNDVKMLCLIRACPLEAEKVSLDH